MNTPFFFLHIPRTAGTTLNRILQENFTSQETLSIYSKRDFTRHTEHSSEELASIRLIQGHLLLPEFTPPRIYGLTVQPFTFLREPVSRLISEYQFLRTWEKNHLYTYLHQNNITFGQYISSTEKILRYRGKNMMTRCISGEDFPLDKYPYKALAKAKRHLEKVFVFVGIQERFVESLVLLGEVMQLQTLFHEKRNALTEHSKVEIAEADKLLAKEMNKADADLYDFACNLLEERIREKGVEFTKRMQNFQLLNQKYQKVSRLLQERVLCADTQQNPLSLPKESLW